MADKLKSDAVAAFDAGNLEKALALAKQALPKFIKEGNQVDECDLICKVVVEAYVARGDGERAVTFAERALAISQRTQDTASLAASFYAMASARYAAGSDDAMEAASKALSYYEDSGNKPKQVSALGMLAKCALVLKEEPVQALSNAKKALALAKDVGDGALVGEATLSIVEAHVSSGTVSEGMDIAEEEYVNLSKKTDRAGLTNVMEAVVLALTAKSGPDVALEKVKTYITDSRSAGDTKGEGWMLFLLGGMTPVKEEAKNSFRVALDLAKKVGDMKLETQVKAGLTDLYAGMNKVDKAPNRSEALGILAEVGRALEDKNDEVFEEEYKHLTNFWPALTQHDFDKVINKVVTKDEKECTKFLKAHGILQEEEKKTKAPGSEKEMGVCAMPTEIMYMTFRYGGLGYGPRFRCNSGYGLKVEEEDKNEAFSCIQLQDCSDDWEREMAYSSSIMDCTLHTGNAMGYRGY
jgi:tetratricopeptide (TPR) repeat protein